MTVQLTIREKIAALVISLGSEVASKVYQYLSEDEVGIITYEISNFKAIDSAELSTIQKDFYELCYTHKVVAEGGKDVARDILVKAYGVDKAEKLIEKLDRINRPKLFEFLKKADSKSIINIIQHEHPQTIALILSYVNPQQASEVLAALTKDKKIDVIERIAKMDKTNPEVLAYVEKELEQKFVSVVAMDYEELGGVNYVAEVINYMDRTSERQIFEELNKVDLGLSEEIRSKMFVFEDITQLDDRSIQTVLREIDNNDLVLAIKGSTAEVEELLFANMSKRNIQTVQSELEYAKNVRLRDVEDAQQRIVEVIRQLEESGEIVISKGGKDEIIA